MNPTLLTLARQRGGIDCGGLDYLVIAYGSFFQLVMAIDGGLALRLDRLGHVAPLGTWQ